MRSLTRFISLGACTLLLTIAGCPDPGDPIIPGVDVVDGGAETVGDVPPSDVPPGDVPPGDVPPGDVPPSDVPPSDVPPSDVPPSDVPPSDVPPSDVPPGDVPTDIPVTDVPPPQGCAPLVAPAEGTCSVVEGDATKILLEGDLVLPNGIQEAGKVLIVNGSIACVGCDCAEDADAATATRITCANGVISAGLINAHDHITWAQDTPKSHGDVRYDHRHEWRKGAPGKPKITTYQNSNALGDAWGEMRQTMGGTTSLFGSGGEGGFLRNLDRGNLLEGLSHPAGDYSTFPMGDSSGSLFSSGCGGYNPDDPAQAASESAYVPHIAEGIIAAAQNEFLCASGDTTLADSVDFVNDNAAFIHGIGLKTADIGLMAAEGTALVWSPRSNTDLYGMTANAPVYDRLGALIALGTDWTPSGSMHLLRELACAETWNGYWENHFTDADLIAMVTHNAAEALGFSDVLGSLTVGKVGDIAIWNGATNTGYRAILDAEPTDVVLVLRGGVPLYGDDTLVEATSSPGDCEVLDVCGSNKRICTQRELGTTVPALTTDLGSFTYDLFFCGLPDNEPSCVPARPGEYDGQSSATDSDGDGIPDAQDNCPNTFNPLRPVDDNVQVDADADGTGDECDPCPFDANTTACTSINPLDIDGDGIEIPADNCPTVQNAGQEDADGDGSGDACDPCKDFFNPGGGPCPGTIYDVKQGITGEGDSVLIQGAIVTVVGFNFIVVQVDPASTGYTVPEYSGLYVYFPDGPFPAVGDRVDVGGGVNNFFGQIQLDNATVTVIEQGVGVPPALTIDAAELITGSGANAAAYEALLVTVTDTAVTNTDPTPQDGETVEGEFEVAGGLPVDDLLYLIDPQPALDQVIPSITGFIRYSWERNKLCPRSAEDVGLGAPYLLSFGPTGSVVYDLQTAVPTIPAMEIRLNTTSDAPIFVAVASDNAAVTVDGGGVTIPAGELTAEVLVTTTGVASDVTLTATLDTDVLTATVSVLDPAVAPVVTGLAPATGTIATESTLEMTVTLNVPAPPAGAVVDVSASTGGLSVPATVNIPAGALSATFDVTAGTTEEVVTVSASVAGGTAQTAELTITAAQLVGLLMVEVFYDPVSGDDAKEWVKLYNGTGGTVDLSGYSLGYGGGTYANATAQLSGTVPAGACFLVGGPDIANLSTNTAFDQVLNFDPDIQNSGSVADGIGLFDVAASAITASTVPVDAVVYGESNDDNFIGPDGSPVATPHVGDAPSNSSLVRTGVDTWTINETPDSTGCIVIQ